jgi:hypothetical protein
MSADPARAALDRELLAWMAEPWGGSDEEPSSEARFDALARRLFAFQLARCPAWARFCAARGRAPESIRSWREIPPVPAGAFKELALRSFPAERTVKTFRTSGTSTALRGELHLDTLALYEASLLPSFEHFVLPELEGRNERLPIFVLAPAPGEAPDSSLCHMFGVVMARRGAAQSGWLLRHGRLELAELLRRLEAAAAAGGALLLCGTAFAFVHLIDALAEQGRKLALPAGSRVMETGGFKGRSREVSRGELYAGLEAALGVPEARIVNQYGMTELGSQFYDSVLCEPDATRRKLGPPWARVRILDPESGEECAPGEIGAIAVTDLANTGSVCAILTADLGRTVGNGFEVLGRKPGAEDRGCSIASDVMLAGAPG